MHILKISTLVINLLHTKIMPCFFPCKHKKLTQSTRNWARDKGITVVIKKVFLLLLYHHLLHQLIIGMNIECVFALPLYFHGCAVKLSLNLSAQKKKSNARFIGLYIIRLYKVAAKVVYCYYARLLLRVCLRPTQYKFLKNLVPKLQIYPIHKNDLLYSSH